MERGTGARATAGSGIGLIGLAAVVWGTIGVGSGWLFAAVPETNPPSVGFYRLAVAVPALVALGWWLLGDKLLAVRRRDLALMAGIGCGMALYQLAYYGAIQRVGVSVAALVTLCTAPVMVALLAAPLLGERLTRTALLALVGALTGTTLLVGAGPETLATAPDMPAGVALAVTAGAGYAGLVLCGRGLAARYHPIQPIAVGFGAGAVLLLPLALATGLTLDYPPAGWAVLAYLGLVPTTLGYLLFQSGLRRTGATTASIVTLIEPLTSAGLAALLFGERLGPTGLLGAALLLASVAVLGRR